MCIHEENCHYRTDIETWDRTEYDKHMRVKVMTSS